MRCDPSILRTTFGVCRFAACAVFAVALALASWTAPAHAGAAPAPAAAPPASAGAIPIFNGLWNHGPLDELEPLPWQPASTRHLDGPLDRGNVYVVFAGDPTNPNLKPWAAEVVKKISDDARAKYARGDIIITNNPQESCKPSGVPNAILLPGPVQFLQEHNQVTILYQRDHQVRRAHITGSKEHSRNLRPTPYGESIAWYEGDTLVIDTIGMTADTPLDMFGTPHTEALHVEERYRLINNGTQLEVGIYIEDPNTFHRPFKTRMVYNRNNAAGLVEEICAENNRLPTEGDYAIPVARPGEPRY
jgi:hypothetical protein